MYGNIVVNESETIIKSLIVKNPIYNQQLLEASPEAMIILDQKGNIIQANTQADSLFGYKNGELVGLGVEELVPQRFAKKHTILRRKYSKHPTSRQMNSEQSFSGKRKDDSEFFADISLRPFEENNEKFVIASIRNITHHIEIQAELAQKVSQLEALHDIGVAISSAQGLDYLLKLIVDQAVDLVNASSCSVLMPDGESGELIFRAAVDDIVGMVVPPGRGIAARVLKSGVPEVVNDAPNDPDYYAMVEVETQIIIETILVVPLLVDDRAIGVLSAVNKKEGEFTQADAEFLLTLASHAAISIQNARLYEKIQRDSQQLGTEVAKRTEALRASQSALKLRNLELNRLYRASDTLFFSSAPNLEDVGLKIVEAVSAEFSKSNCSLLVVVPGDNELKRVAVLGSYAEEVSKGKLTLDGSGLVPKAIRTGKLANVPDVRKSPDYVANWKAARSELAIPLKTGDQVIGVIDVQSKEVNAFGADDIRLITIFAERAALALESVRLFDAERQRRKEAETLRQASAVVAATLHQEIAIDEILIQLARVIPYDSASVQLLVDGYLEIVGGRGWADLSEVVGIRFPVPGDNPNTEVIKTKSAVIHLNTPAKFPVFLDEPHSHIRSWLGVPLIVRDRVIGMLALDSENENFYKLEHTRLATAFADQVAIAIDNAQLFEQTQSTLAETQMLYRIAHSIIGTENLTDLLQIIVNNIADYLPADRVSLITFDSKQREIKEYVRGGAGKEKSLDINFDELWDGLSGWVIRELKPALSPKGINDNREGAQVQKRRQETECGSIIVVPLIHREEVMGTLTVINKCEQVDFSWREVELLETIASQAAIAIENARLFEEIQWLATTDELLGINNRRHLFELGRREVERARRYKHPLSAIMLDIDHFKKINDSHGHGVGDQVLRQIAQGCLQSVREFDILGRYGGEEFAIVLPETERLKAQKTAERLRVSIEQQPINTTAGALSVTISLGVALLQDGMTDLASLLDAADSALYLAKQSGRNRVEVNE